MSSVALTSCPSGVLPRLSSRSLPGRLCSFPRRWCPGGSVSSPRASLSHAGRQSNPSIRLSLFRVVSHGRGAGDLLPGVGGKRGRRIIPGQTRLFLVSPSSPNRLSRQSRKVGVRGQGSVSKKRFAFQAGSSVSLPPAGLQSLANWPAHAHGSGSVWLVFQCGASASFGLPGARSFSQGSCRNVASGRRRRQTTERNGWSTQLDVCTTTPRRCGTSRRPPPRRRPGARAMEVARGRTAAPPPDASRRAPTRRRRLGGAVTPRHAGVRRLRPKGSFRRRPSRCRRGRSSARCASRRSRR